MVGGGGLRKRTDDGGAGPCTVDPCDPGEVRRSGLLSNLGVASCLTRVEADGYDRSDGRNAPATDIGVIPSFRHPIHARTQTRFAGLGRERNGGFGRAKCRSGHLLLLETLDLEGSASSISQTRRRSHPQFL